MRKSLQLRLVLVLPASSIILGGLGYFLLRPSSPEICVYRILTYDNLSAPSGWLRKVFPSATTSRGCRFEWVSVADSGEIRSRLLMDQKRQTRSYDLVVGLDLGRVEGLLSDMPTLPSLTEPFVIDPAMGFPAELQSKVLPFNWGVMAWMVDLKAYRELGVARPAEIGPEELLKWKGQWVVSDPRSSSPGMGFLRWLSGFPEWEVTLKNLSQTWRSLPTGWSQAYGLFLEGKAHTVWSYQTSEAYHRKQSTGGDRFVAIPPKGGAPRQIEVLFAWSPDSYEDLKWIQQILFAEGAQRWIPETQWMFPARAGTPLPESFSGISPFSGAPHFGNSSTSDRELLEKFEGSLWQR